MRTAGMAIAAIVAGMLIGLAHLACSADDANTPATDPDKPVKILGIFTDDGREVSVEDLELSLQPASDGTPMIAANVSQIVANKAQGKGLFASLGEAIKAHPWKTAGVVGAAVGTGYAAKRLLLDGGGGGGGTAATVDSGRAQPVVDKSIQIHADNGANVNLVISGGAPE